MPVASPLFSVVIPTYNSAPYIERALHSVFSQEEKNFELLVSDDGSTDATIKIAEHFLAHLKSANAKIIKNHHKGPGAARNRGVLGSSGEWIAFLDSDDQWRPNKLAAVKNFISKYPKVDLWCHNEMTAKNGIEIPSAYQNSFDATVEPFLSLYRKNALSTSAVTVRRSFLMETNLFDETLPSAQDYDLWLRLSQRGKIEFIPEVLGQYLVRNHSISSHISRRLGCLITIGGRYYSDLKKVSKYPLIDYLYFCARAFRSSVLDWMSSMKSKLIQKKVSCEQRLH